MTEQEAKTKWCPMSANRTVSAQCKDGSTDVARWNTKESDTGLSTICIASDCMMWRWKITKSGAAEMNAQTGRLVMVHESGYCGLAGKP